MPHHFLPYRNVSPYNYCGNNPLVLKDPTGFGWAGEGKLKKAFKDAVKGAKDIGLGVFDAVASDITGQDVRTGDQNSTLYKSAKLTTHAADAYLGISLASGGTVAEFVGVVAAPETGGTSLVLTGGGAVATAGGLWVTGNALQHGAIMLSQASQSGGGGEKEPEKLKYAPSKKHEKGGWGTEMDLDDATGQKVLDQSTLLGKQRYSYHNGKVYEFQPDNVGGWHGYPIKAQELVNQKGGTGVMRQWIKEGKLTKADYNKLIKA